MCVCISVCVTGMSSVTISIKSLAGSFLIVQELCESRGGRPNEPSGFRGRKELLNRASAWSQLVPNMSTDI